MASGGGNKNGEQRNDRKEGGEDAGGAGGAPGGWFKREDAVNVVVAGSCVHGVNPSLNGLGSTTLLSPVQI